jgi:hypothetical protein
MTDRRIRPSPQLIWSNPRPPRAERRRQERQHRRAPPSADPQHEEALAVSEVAHRLRLTLKGTSLSLAIAALGVVSARGLAHVEDDDFEQWISALRKARAEARQS